jgi:hypothetical protein
VSLAVDPTEPLSAQQRAWRESINAAALKAVADLRADNAFAHRLLIAELEELIARIGSDDLRRP